MSGTINVVNSQSGLTYTDRQSDHIDIDAPLEALLHSKFHPE